MNAQIALVIDPHEYWLIVKADDGYIQRHYGDVHERNGLFFLNLSRLVIRLVALRKRYAENATLKIICNEGQLKEDFESCGYNDIYGYKILVMQYDDQKLYQAAIPHALVFHYSLIGLISGYKKVSMSTRSAVALNHGKICRQETLCDAQSIKEAKRLTCSSSTSGYNFMLECPKFHENVYEF